MHALFPRCGSEFTWSPADRRKGWFWINSAPTCPKSRFHRGAPARTTTVDWWESADPKKYFFSFPYQNDETPLFYLRKLRVPLALRGSQNPKVEGPLARCPSFPVGKSRRSSVTRQLPRKKFTSRKSYFPVKKFTPPSDPIVDQTTFPKNHRRSSDT